MARDGTTVIEIWSSEDDATPYAKAKKIGQKDIDRLKDMDCFILDFNPFLDISKKLSIEPVDEDLSIVDERGQVACRDYPHSRHLCVKFPFSQTPHESYCEQCYCYVCDTIAPCKYWNLRQHCHASENETKWKNLRREGQGIAPVNALNVLPVTALNVLQ